MTKVLLVDDEERLLQNLSFFFEDEGYEVFSVTSGEDAVEIAKKEKPDLIIMDIMMPGNIDGLEATKIIKDDPETRNITILILTAKGQKEDIKNGRKAGADGYFIKPFSPLELIRKVESVLDY